MKISALIFVLLLLPVATDYAQTTDGPFQFVPMDNCRRCHISTLPGQEVRMIEWTLWESKDKHLSAYEVLKGDRSQRMGKLLGKDVFAKPTGCVQCHTANVEDHLYGDRLIGSDKDLFISQGVSCQACHGPASSWESAHALKNGEWQQKTSAEKAELGFNDLEDPVRRASMCASCHIGNAKLGRVITHEMYAAGHPMLSGFDMEAFADKMPRHWEYQEEKEKRLDSPQQAFQFERTRGVLVASVIGLRAAIDLADDGQANWPELARLECYSCHHQLRSPSWRQESHVERFAGRPRLELGCLPIIRVAAQIATGNTQSFDALVEKSRDVFAHNLFGDPAALAALRATVDEWATKAAQELADMPLDAAQVEEILMLLVNATAEGTHDYDTARQLTGAIYVVGEELKRSGAQVPGLEPLLTRLKALQDSEDGFALVSTEDKRVEDKFGLQLRNRARFKPKVYAELFKSLRAKMK